MADETNPEKKPAPFAPKASESGTQKPESKGGWMGFLSNLFKKTPDEKPAPPLAPASNPNAPPIQVSNATPKPPSTPSGSSPRELQERFASLTATLGEIEPISISVPEKQTPAVPSMKGRSRDRGQTPASPASANAPPWVARDATVPMAPSATGVALASTSGAKPETKGAKKPALFDDLRSHAEAEQLAGGIVHRRYLLTEPNPNPINQPAPHHGKHGSPKEGEPGYEESGASLGGGESTYRSRRQQGDSGSHGTSDELTDIMTDVMPELKSHGDDKYKKNVGLMSDAPSSDAEKPLAKVSASDQAKKDEFASLFGEPGKSGGSGGTASSKETDNSNALFAQLGAMNTSVPKTNSNASLMDAAKSAPENPPALAKDLPAHPVFCPYCGNPVSGPGQAAKVTDKGDTLEYVCAHCGETVTVKKPQPSTPKL